MIAVQGAVHRTGRFCVRGHNFLPFVKTEQNFRPGFPAGVVLVSTEGDVFVCAGCIGSANHYARFFLCEADLGGYPRGYSHGRTALYFVSTLSTLQAVKLSPSGSLRPAVCRGRRSQHSLSVELGVHEHPCGRVRRVGRPGSRTGCCVRSGVARTVPERSVRTR